MSGDQIDSYIEKHADKQKVLERLREIVLSTGLKEEVKWGMPTYTYMGKNIVGLGAFKEYAGLWFFQGVFLSDPHHLLINAQENKTKALRQLRLYEGEDVSDNILREYIEEAILNQKKGKEIKVDRSKSFELHDLLKSALDKDDKIKTAFERFTPGKQKEFSEYLQEAKREETQVKRLEKIKPLIIKGIGLNDKYKH